MGWQRRQLLEHHGYVGNNVLQRISRTEQAAETYPSTAGRASGLAAPPVKTQLAQRERERALARARAQVARRPMVALLLYRSRPGPRKALSPGSERARASWK